MKKIGIISDTHGFIHPKVYEFFNNCDEIWHAGDIGGLDAAYELKAFKPLIAVHGNIDDFSTQTEYPEIQRFKAEETDVLITHIGGYPGNYSPKIREIIKVNPPKLFISGHSHILKVMNDKKNNLLHINPGAAGKSGFHKVITMIRLVIDGQNIKDLEVFELKR
ncbi:MAG: metallophosphoesterase family protein [Bacteroidota bacterium]